MSSVSNVKLEPADIKVSANQKGCGSQKSPTSSGPGYKHIFIVWLSVNVKAN